MVATCHVSFYTEAFVLISLPVYIVYISVVLLLRNKLKRNRIHPYIEEQLTEPALQLLRKASNAVKFSFQSSLL